MKLIPKNPPEIEESEEPLVQEMFISFDNNGDLIEITDKTDNNEDN